jgi:Tol biopolymer transport system component
MYQWRKTMLKKNAVLFWILAVLPTVVLAQIINVQETITAVDLPSQRFTSPQFSPDGNQILFSEVGYRGLWLYDLKTKQIRQLNDLPGAGFAPLFSANGDRIYFWSDQYINFRRYSSLASQNINDSQIQYLIENERRLFPVTMLADETIIYRQNKELKSVSRTTKAAYLSKPIEEIFGYSEGQKMVLVINGIRKELTPFGANNYIWFSLSPDKTRLLFTVAGGGTFIADLNGQILVKLGKANAPKWSPDGKWIVYMVDEDDGHTFTASDIWVATSDGMTKLQLTHTSHEIEMFPAWSPQMDKIVFETFSGKIAFLSIEIK